MCFSREAHSSLKEEAYLLGSVGDGKEFIYLSAVLSDNIKRERIGKARF